MVSQTLDLIYVSVKPPSAGPETMAVLVEAVPLISKLETGRGVAGRDSAVEVTRRNWIAPGTAHAVTRAISKSALPKRKAVPPRLDSSVRDRMLFLLWERISGLLFTCDLKVFLLETNGRAPARAPAHAGANRTTCPGAPRRRAVPCPQGTPVRHRRRLRRESSASRRRPSSPRWRCRRRQ
jgi:hypothetical protein